MSNKKSFLDRVVETLTGQKKKEKPHTKKRKLGIESLEVRELLSVSPLTYPLDNGTAYVRIDSTQDAYENGQAGYFRLERNDTAGSLAVHYELDYKNNGEYYSNYEGHAKNGSDFQWLPGTNDWQNCGVVTFLDGQQYVDIAITPINDNWIEGNEQITLKLTDAGNCYYCYGQMATYSIDPNNSTATLNIIDDEVPIYVWIDSTLDAVEGGQNGYVRLRRDDTIASLTVNFILDSRNGGDYYSSSPAGWAKNGVDFQWLSGTSDYNNYGTITFAAGQEYVDIALAAINDNYIEGDENVKITLTETGYDGCGYGAAGKTYFVDSTRKEANVSIIDDEPEVTVRINSIQNGTEGSQNGYFRLKRDDTTRALTVHYELDYRNGSYCYDNYEGWAKNGVDFQQLPGTNDYENFGTITFAIGQEYADIPIIVNDDSLTEGTENVKITLRQYSYYDYCSPGVSYFLDTDYSSATLSILDNETPITVWIDSVQNAVEGGQAGYFRLKRDTTSGSMSVWYDLNSSNNSGTAQSGWAKNGTDLNWLSNTNGSNNHGWVTFQNGQDYVDIVVTPINDNWIEGTEVIEVTLSNLKGDGGGERFVIDPDRATAQVSILDDEIPITVSIESVQHAAENGSNGYFRLYRDVTAGALTVWYSLDSRNGGHQANTLGWGTNGLDFSYLPGTNWNNNRGSVTFADGQAYVDIPITVTDDARMEGTESVRIQLESNTAGTTYLIDEQNREATLTIADNESVVNVWIHDSANGTEGGSNGSVTFKRDVTTTSLTVYYQIDSKNSGYYDSNYVGWAKNGTDFQWLPGTNEYENYGYFTFAAGQETFTLPINAIDDNWIEDTEVLGFALLQVHPYYSYGEDSDIRYLLDPETSSVDVSIFDNDIPVTVWMEKIRDGEEGGENGLVRIHRDDTTKSLTVYYEMDWRNGGDCYSNYEGWAKNGVDFQRLPGSDYYYNYGSVTFAAGQSYIDIPIIVVDDSYAEEMELLQLTLTQSQGCYYGCQPGVTYLLDIERNSTTVQIFDNDEEINVWVDSSQNAVEGGQAGYVRLKRDVTTKALTVHYQLDYRNGGCYYDNYSGWAKNGTDFNWLPGTDGYDNYGHVTFAAGQEYVDIVIAPIDDNVIEGTEQIQLTLSQSSDCYSGCGNAGVMFYLDNSRKTATVSIFDDDIPTQVWIDSTQNGTEGGTNGYVRLRRDETTSALTVYYEIDSKNGGNVDHTGWAKNGTDFSWLPGTNRYNNHGNVTFAAGQEYVDIPIVVIDDTSVEGTEQLVVTLTTDTGNGNVVSYSLDSGRKSTTVAVFDNDVTANIWFDGVQGGMEGVRDGYFRLRRDFVTNELTVRYRIDSAGSTSTYGQDYTITAGTANGNDRSITFAAGQEYVDIPISVVDDELIEGNETVRIELLPPNDPLYRIDGNATATLAIVDNDDVMLVTAGGPYECEPGGNVILSADIVNDPGGLGNWTFSWDLDNDGIFETSGQSVNFSGAGLAAGNYFVAVKAVDSEGNIATDTTTMTVIVRRAELNVTLPGNGNQAVDLSQPLVFPSAERGNSKSLTLRISNTGNTVLTLDWPNAVLPTGISVLDASPTIVAAGSHDDVTFIWDAAENLDGPLVISTNDPDHPMLQISLFGIVVAVENPPVVDSFGLLHDSGADNTDRITFNPKVTGTVSGNFAGGTVVVEFDHDGDAIADGSVVLTEAGGFIYDPSELDENWPIATDMDIDVVFSYRLVHLDSFGQAFSTGNWNEFDYTLTPAPGFEGTVSNLVAEIAEGADWSTSYGVTLRGYVPGSQKIEIYVDSTGERIVTSALSYNWFSADLRLGIPYGETTTIRVRGIVHDTTSQMDLYGDWSVLTVSPSPPDLTSFTLKRDTGNSSSDGISNDLTLTGRIDSYLYDDYDYRYQRNAHIEIEFRCDDTVLGHSFTDENGEFTFNPMNLPLVDGVPQGTVTARTVYRDSNGDPVYGNAVSKWIRYEAAASPNATGFSLVDPKPGNVSNSGKVKASVDISINSDVRLEYSYMIDSEWSEGSIVVPFNPNELAENATRETRTGEFRIPNLTTNAQVEVRVRTLVYDSMLDDYVAGNWSMLTFNYVMEVNAPASIQDASVKNWTGTAYVSTADPTVIGAITNDGELEGLTVEAWVGNKIVGTATTDASGTFTVRPSGMSYGQNTLQIKVREWNSRTESWQYGAAWTTTFELLARTVSMPAIEYLVLSDNTGPLDGTITSNPRFEGKIAIDGENINRVLIEIDLDNDQIPDTFVFTDSNGRFGYTPDLSIGQQTIKVRACRFDSVEGDWVTSDWSTLIFTLTLPDAGWTPEIKEIGPAFIKSNDNNAVTTNDPALLGKLTSQGGFSGITVQVDLGSDNVVDHEMVANADGSFRWRPLIDTAIAATVSGRVRAGRLDEVTNQVVWGDWTSFEYDYVPDVHDRDRSPETEQATILRLVYVKDETTGAITAEGVRITGPDNANRSVAFDLDGDGTADFNLATDSNGFIAFERIDLSGTIYDENYEEREKCREGLYFGDAWIASSGDDSDRIRFVVVKVNENSEFDEAELLQQQQEFYAGYTTLLEAYDELEQLLGQISPVEAPTDVGETMTDEQYAAAQAKALAQLGLTAADLDGISGVTAPVFSNPISTPMPELENNIEYQVAVERINNEYRAAIADLNRQFSLQETRNREQYDQVLSNAWGSYHSAIYNIERSQSLTPQPADSVGTPALQAAWAHQSIEASHAFETQSLQAMAAMIQASLAQQAAYQNAVNAIHTQAVLQMIAAMTAATGGGSGIMTMSTGNGGNSYLAQFVANAVAEMLANLAATNAYNEAVNDANQQAATTSLQAWKSASQQVLDANKSAQKAKIDAWKDLRQGAIGAQNEYNDSIKKANEKRENDSKNAFEQFSQKYIDSKTQFAHKVKDHYTQYEDETKDLWWSDKWPIKDNYDATYTDMYKENLKDIVSLEKDHLKEIADIEKAYSHDLTEADSSFEKTCIGLLESYWKAILGVETGLQNACLGASSGYASTLNGAESSLSSALLGASTAYATATTNAARTRAHADLGVESAMLGEEGADCFAEYFAACADLTGAAATYYNTIGEIDQGLFDTSLGAATGLVSALLGKSFGAELASIGVSAEYGGAVNGAASAYAGSMLDVSEEYAGAGIDIGDAYSSDVIDAKIEYMKNSNNAENKYRKKVAENNADTTKKCTDFRADYANSNIDQIIHIVTPEGMADFEVVVNPPTNAGVFDDAGSEGLYGFNQEAFNNLELKNAEAARELVAKNMKALLSYNSSIAGAAKSYAKSASSAARTAARSSYEAAESAMEGERDAAEAYCAAVQAAAETATEALIAIAEQADPTAEIVSYLLSMAQAEMDAEINRMAALGAYQIAVKTELLQTLEVGTVPYQAAVEDLAWTQTVVEARESFATQSGEATMVYYSSVYSAMSEYDTASRQLQNERTMTQLRREYANSARLRQNAWDNAERRLAAERTYELALLDAAFTKWENEANFEADAAASILANFQSGLDGIDGAEASAAIGMYDNLNTNLSGWQSASASALSTFRNEQNAIYNATVSAAQAAAAALERGDDAAEATDSSAARTKYESRYYGDLAAYALADAELYAAYVAAVETAQRNFDAEQCRLLGLLADSVDTGSNKVAEGTTSLDVQVCFVAGTKIRLKNGEVKTIEELKKGLLSKAARHDDPTGEISDFEIIELYESETDRLVEIVFENESTGKRFSTKSTPEHPFYVYDKDWIAAKDVLSGDECRSASDQRITVVSVTELTETCKVYNFQVKSAHTYFVGESDDESVLVHNRCFQHPYESDPTCIDCFKSGDKDVPFITTPLPSSTVVNKNVQQITGITFNEQQKINEAARQLINKEAAGMIDTGFPSGGTGGLDQITVGTFDMGKLGVGVAAKIDNASALGKYLMRHPTKFSRLHPMFSVYVGAEYTYIFTDNINVSAGGRVGVRGVDDRGNIDDVDFNIGSEIRYQKNNIQLFFGPRFTPDGYIIEGGLRLK